ncbi:alpha/beta fold hydrolase, partial [Kibdelosporangium lantanae]
VDLVHDEADAGRKVACPTLALWGRESFVGQNYDVLAVWRDHAVTVTGKALPSNHYVPEEAPTETVAALRGFLGS